MGCVEQSEQYEQYEQYEQDEQDEQSEQDEQDRHWLQLIQSTLCPAFSASCFEPVNSITLPL